MPTVPRYEANQIREAGLPQDRIDARVSADAFGAGEARALSGAFQEAGKIVQDYTNYADQVAIMEAQKKATELETTLLYDPKVGALNQKGKNAFTLQESVPAAYKKGIEEMPGYEEISEELLHSARVVIEADNKMQRIKDKIGMFHEI